MPEQRTEEFDEILEELDELINVIPDETVSNIQNQLENIRHKIKLETLSEEDQKIMNASNSAAEVLAYIYKFKYYIEKHKLTEYVNITELERSINYWDNNACHLDNLARGQC